MLIRYSYDPTGQIFYQHNSNIVPRVGETVLFDVVDDKDCFKRFEFVKGKKVEEELFTVTDVCYCISAEETEVDVTVMDYDYGSDHTEYLENLAKDVNVPNAYC